jgi:hypothetical protein
LCEQNTNEEASMSTGQDTAIGNGTVVTDRGVQAEVLTGDGVHLRYIDQGAGRHCHGNAMSQRHKQFGRE